MQNPDQLDGTGSFRELLGQTKVMQIRQGETQIRQRETTHDICYLAAKWTFEVNGGE
jgi:hypothetical protein